jgi:hypothetical protein
MDVESDSLCSHPTDGSFTAPKQSIFAEYCRTITPGEDTHDEKGQLLYPCLHCDWKKPHTSNFRLHLQKQHNIRPLTHRAARTNPSEAAAQELLELYDTLRGKIETKQLDSKLLQRVIDKDAIKQCLVDLIVVQCLPLNCVERPEFHRFCLSLNPEARTMIPSSHNTIKSWIEQSFDSKKDIVRKTLQSAKTRIHLSIDVWTSPNTHLVFAVCGHFINIDGQRQTLLLAYRTIDEHAGEVQFEQGLLPVLEDYQIVQRVGALMGDNASTNDTLCRTTSQYLRQQYPRDPEWISHHQRLRCLGHILNLVVQSFLFPKEADLDELDSYDYEEERGNQLDDSQQEQKKNKIRAILGPLGKLHNIVVHIRSSPNRTKQFVDTLNAKVRIPLDNRTRWNSWYKMLSVVFSKDNPLELILSRYVQYHVDKLSYDIISTQEWLQLCTIYECLSCFNSATLVAEGHRDTATIGCVLENLDICDFYLRKLQVIYRTIIDTKLIILARSETEVQRRKILNTSH